jgi:monovalent cation:H+ antiporter-2, CPA2 family
MEELALVHDLAVVWLAALIAGAASVRLRLPAIAGYIIGGLIVGPFGLRLIAETEQIKVLAELGVALLLFALGVELSVRKIFMSSFGRMTAAGVCQVVGTTVVFGGLAYGMKLVPTAVSAVLFGVICSLSSTAVVTKLLVDRAETETLHGRTIVPILLMQDLSLVPVVALLPALANLTGGSAMLTLVPAAGKALALIIGVVIGAVAIVPRILAFVARTNSRELFLLTVISICLTVALISKEMGISLALGAFLSGIMISGRPHAHQVLADIMPVTDLFSTLFFVSIGMLLDPTFIFAHWLELAGFVAVLLVLKAAIATAAAYISTQSLWSSILTGVALAQVGEFSFVLATLAHDANLLPSSAYNLFFAASVVTLTVSPVFITLTPKILSRIPQARLMRRVKTADETKLNQMREHLVLCGFGRMGASIGLTLHGRRVPLVVVEIDGTATDVLEGHGIPYIYGDAFNAHVLQKAHLESARCLIITIPDPVVALHVIAYARRENEHVHVIARATRFEHVQMFREAGANVVVQPEFEASIEATKQAMMSMNRPQDQILEAVRDIRREGNRIFQMRETPAATETTTTSS